jgi:hypothetical protein
MIRAVVAASITFVMVLLTGVAPVGGQTNPTAQLLSKSVLTWEIASAGQSPPPLTNASMVYDNDTQTVVLFGGETASGALSNNTWVWNGSTWTDLPGSRVQAPPARQLAAMAFDPVLHQLILFGGEGAGGIALGDTWAWNGASWYQITPFASQVPPARFGASMTFDNNGQIVLFGGTGYSSQPAASSSTTPGATTAPTTTTSPTSAPATTSSTTSAALVLGPPIPLSDTWIWTGAGWAPVTGPGPSARSEAAMAYDSTTGQTVLFGGQSGPVGSVTSRLLADTWTWNGSRWSERKPTAVPPARVGATLSDGPDLAAVVMFGGAGTSSEYADTWLWTGSNWLRAPAIGLPLPTRSAAAAYDKTTGSELVFGGSSGGSAQGTAYLLVVSDKGASAVTSLTTTTRPAGHQPTSSSTSGGHSSTVPPPTTTPSARAVPAGGNAPLRETATDLRPGSLVTLSGSGFRPNSVVTITFHSNPVFIGRVLADQTGTFTETVTVPVNAPAGTHHFEASGTAAQGSPIHLVASVLVLGPSHRADPSAVQTIALVGAALLIPGAAWLAMSGMSWVRRRSGPTRPA